MSKYAKIKELDIANGKGIRTSVFFSGCPHHCKGCFNKETWNENIGNDFTEETIDNIIVSLDNEYTSGLSLLGGEPLAPYNIDAAIDLCRNVYTAFPNKNIWVWTGYKLEDLNNKQKEILNYIDVLIDGPFIEELKDLSISWRGSSNQRILKKGQDF